MQVITYHEFLPMLLGSSYSTYIPQYSGCKPSVDPTIPNSFATAAYRFGHSLVKPQFARLDSNSSQMDMGPLSLHDSFYELINTISAVEQIPYYVAL